MQTLLLHLSGEEPIMAEVEALPQVTDTVLFCINPRRRDGEELHYVLAEVQTIIVPLQRVNFIEILPSGAEEEIISPFAD